MTDGKTYSFGDLGRPIRFEEITMATPPPEMNVDLQQYLNMCAAYQTGINAFLPPANAPSQALTNRARRQMDVRVREQALEAAVAPVQYRVDNALVGMVTYAIDHTMMMQQATMQAALGQQYPNGQLGLGNVYNAGPYPNNYMAQTCFNAPVNFLGTAAQQRQVSNDEARDKARDLLQQLLTTEQWEDYKERGKFIVIKNNQRYQLGCTQVQVVDEELKLIESWCVYCAEGPWEDTVIAHYLHIMESPEKLRKRSNVTHYRGREAYTEPQNDERYLRRDRPGSYLDRALNLIRRAGYR